MVDARFFKNQGPFSLGEIEALTGSKLMHGSASALLHDVCALDRASANDISFLDNPKYIDNFSSSAAGACFIREKFVLNAPAGMALFVTPEPYYCYAITANKFYPPVNASGGIHASALIDASATLGEGCTVEAGAVIKAHARIGRHSVIGANAVIGEYVEIGENSAIGATSTLTHCLLGNSVIIHRSVHIGQDGFGYAFTREGHVKVPQLGRVVIEDNVEVGSGTCIDRGTGPDTYIGAGSKIDNLVQIGHNVTIGRHCIIVSQVGIAGSTRIGDGAVLGGQAGIAGHIKIGAGAKVAAKAGVMQDVPAGAQVGGTPAMPIKEWHRQTVALAKISRRREKENQE